MKSTVVESEATTLDLLLEKVYGNSGQDFREYRRGTVTRRLERRLHATGAKTYLDYMEYLDAHPEEYQRLADEITIKVSGFFRNPHTFQQLGRLVLPELLSSKESRGEPSLRFWSAACAQGEEPYSIAISLAHFLGSKLSDFNVSVYATDVSRQALEEGRAGVYFAKDVEGMPSAIFKDYFTGSGEYCKVRADIRQMLHFSYFDLTSTTQPPLVNLDCIFCCNGLIYLQKQLQEKVLGMLYDSLATPGYLILGEVETPTTGLDGKLECLDAKAKIYKKNGRKDYA